MRRFDRRNEAKRRRLKGRPVYTWGTPPTPEDPAPSNVVIKTYADGSYDMRTPPANPKVIAEYEAAIAAAPECAELRMEFAFSLCLAHLWEAAIDHAREAARLRPDWDRPRDFLKTYFRNQPSDA